MAVPSRLTGSLPVSIVVHLALLVLIFVIPLTAEVALPSPATAIDTYMRAMPVPPMPPAPARNVDVRRRVEPSRAPTEAPPAITPERDEAAVPRPVLEGGVDFGPPAPGAPLGDIAAGSPGVTPPPPAASTPEAPVRVGELVRSPRKITDARPIYPPLARAANVQGTVVLEAVLDRNGHVSQVRVLKSVPLLDGAAIAAVRQWQYSPSTLHGVPVEVLMTITVRFTLQQ